VNENTLCEDDDYSAAESVLIARGSLRNSRYKCYIFCIRLRPDVRPYMYSKLTTENTLLINQVFRQ